MSARHRSALRLVLLLHLNEREESVLGLLTQTADAHLDHES